MTKPTRYLGTYFDLDAVLGLERLARILSWTILIIYTIEAIYNSLLSVLNTVSGGYPLDWFYLMTTLAHVAQGALLFMLLQVAAKVLLILLDIEDNTRRAARANTKES